MSSVAFKTRMRRLTRKYHRDPHGLEDKDIPELRRWIAHARAERAGAARSQVRDDRIPFAEEVLAAKVDQRDYRLKVAALAVSVAAIVVGLIATIVFA